jgi:hypothetical protein
MAHWRIGALARRHQLQRLKDIQHFIRTYITFVEDAHQCGMVGDMSQWDALDLIHDMNP